MEFAGDDATLPIQIDEGRAAQVTAVQLTGVPAERRAGALAAIALPVGSPFAAGADCSGRARLERYYRDLGFRAVQVEAAATLASQGLDVALTFTVNEGAAPRDQRRRNPRRAVDQAVAGEQCGSADGGPAGRRGRRRRHREAAGPARHLPPSRSPPRADVAWAGRRDSPVTALIALEEPRRFQLRYGLELSSDYNSALDQRTNALGVAADIRDRNFLGRACRSEGAAVRARPAERTNALSVPTLRRRPIRTNLFLSGRSEKERDGQLTARDEEINLTFEQRWRASRAIDNSWSYSRDWRDARLTPGRGRDTRVQGRSWLRRTWLR